MSIIRFPSKATTAAGFVLGLCALASAASAASPCKGLAQDLCAADAQCAWVEGYMRKDGRSVAAHCKLKPRRPGAEQTSLAPGQPAVGMQQAR